MLGSLDYFLESASIFPNLLSQIYAHIYAAAAYEKLHRRKDALDELCKALSLALPDGILIAFVENCDLLEPVLKELSLRGEYQDASDTILKQYLPYRQAMEQIRKEHFSEKTSEADCERSRNCQTRCSGVFQQRNRRTTFYHT